MAKAASRRRWTPPRVTLVAAAGLLVVALIAVAAIIVGSQPKAGPETEVVRVTRDDQTTTVTLSGTLAPQQRANASFAVPGTVREIAVKVGDRVEPGSPLARVDDRDLRNAVALADANLAAARAQLRTIQDNAKATSAQIAAAHAQVAAAQASADNASQRLADATLRSPIAGVVATVSVEVGDQVGSGSVSSMGSGSPLGGISIPGLTGTASSSAGSGSASSGDIVVIAPDAWQLDATIGTADLPQIAAGQQAIVTPTGTSTHVAAVVDTVGIVASSSSGSSATFPVTLRITHSDKRLFAGADADATITTSTVPGVLTIPTEAVTHTSDQASVRRSDGSTTTVETGRRFGDRIEVLGGLAEGDEVLVAVGVVVSTPPRPQFGPNGQIVSPDPTPTAGR